MDLSEITARAMRVHGLYDELNEARRGRTWDRQDFVLGFVGDVGDLAKLTQAADGVRSAPPGARDLGHELADCLWSVVVIADLYGVDLEAAFTTTMRHLEESISGELDQEATR
ncbi:MazG nucleotide pyrophosphohydrolase domain-containing protein [Streptomyces sp. BE20]|uniref:MazG nucleotide pyrophosphohydrolase domain-containing protein n=1 Tax=Streptomyces sp. BE20 TaxID=3002525 RepID=UPI002E793A2D|nr:nucleotide pyrophosphohydrolase [Streptomyces sp. BE20]MEE1823799.1 MazG nucleotide pyrophosphohydrolase domain-containing protein [Streptomyces sp. BE20]